MRAPEADLPINHPDRFGEMPENEQALLLAWIALAVQESPKLNTSESSYSLKHHFERVGFYVTNGEFKGAMIAAGHTPSDLEALNATYNIKAVVPAVRDAGFDGQFLLPESPEAEQLLVDLKARSSAS